MKRTTILHMAVATLLVAAACILPLAAQASCCDQGYLQHLYEQATCCDQGYTTAAMLFGALLAVPALVTLAYRQLRAKRHNLAI